MTKQLTKLLAILIALLAGNYTTNAQKQNATSTNIDPQYALSVTGMPVTTAALVVYTKFQVAPSHLVVQSMQTEVESIVSPVGLPVAWQDPANEPTASLGVVIIAFHGDCDVGGRGSLDTGSGPMGWTHVSNGAILSFADLDCDRIRGVIYRDLMTSAPFEREAVLGRAVGRVLAHELYHIFARTQQHSSDGLGKSCLTSMDLTAGRYRFRVKELRLMRVGMSQMREMLRLIRGRTGGSPEAGEYIYQESGCVKCHGRQGQGTRQGPSLRGTGRPMDFESLAAKLEEKAVHTYDWRGRKLAPSQLKDDEIGDLISFLNAIE